jgi:HAD-superfamily hydrolase, subfamily IIB
MVKAFISDIDETILPAGAKYASKEVEAELLGLQEDGIVLILATARILAGVEKLMQQFQMEKYGGYVVSSNGSYIYDCKNKQCLYQTTIPMEMIHQLYEFSVEHELHMSSELHEYNVISGYDAAIEFDWKAVGVNFFLPAGSYLDAVKEEPYKAAFTYDKERLAKVLPIVEEKFGPHLTVQLSQDLYIDMVPYGVTKASGIQRILELLKLHSDEIAAIGDGNNDIPMLQLAGITAVVENASHHIKAHANTIVSSCEEHGVAEFARIIRGRNSLK